MLAEVRAENFLGTKFSLDYGGQRYKIRKTVVQPHGVADDFRRKAMPKVAGSMTVHLSIVPRGELI